MGQWDEPDERVKWAIDLFDRQGVEYTSVLGYYLPHMTLTTIGAAIFLARNKLGRKPLYAGLPFTLAAMGVGFLAGHQFRQWRSKLDREDIATMQHYIMSHPERFIEPERKKYGEACVLLPWACIR